MLYLVLIFVWKVHKCLIWNEADQPILGILLDTPANLIQRKCANKNDRNLSYAVLQAKRILFFLYQVLVLLPKPIQLLLLVLHFNTSDLDLTYGNKYIPKNEAVNQMTSHCLVNWNFIDQ